MKKHYLILLLFPCLLLAGITNVQAQSYTYSLQSGTYIDLIAPTVITANITGNANYMEAISPYPFTLFGETFIFNGVSGLAVGENGFISATNTQGDKAFALDGMFAGITNHPTLSSEISYEEVLSSSGGILIIQFKNVGLSTGASTDFVNFQIWIYEATGDVEYRYGPSSTSSASFGHEGGPVIGLFLASNDFTSVYESQFLVGNAANPTVDFVNTFAHISGMPPDGTVYRFSYSAPVSINENQLENISLFPNPANNSITFNGNNINRVVIVDMLGKTIMDENLKTNKTLNIESLNKGLYLARVYTDSGISAARFIKQ